MRRFFSGFLLFFIFGLSLAHGGGGPQNVALVVNKDSWASLAVANEFIRLRGIPPGNVIYLDNVPNFETVDINVFRDVILKPVLSTIESRHLTPQIDYVVYSSDLPYAVDTTPDHPNQKMPMVITPVASLTSMTFLYERVLAKDTRYLHLNINRYMRYAKVSQDKPLTESEDNTYIHCLTLIDEHRKKYDEALPLLQQLRADHPKNIDVLYNLACCLSRLKKLDEAMTVLQESVDAGWFNAPHMLEDDDLALLRERKDFKALLDKLEKTYVETQAPMGFRNSIAWNGKGEISPEGIGDHYLLSTMLAVTSGRGTSVPEALDYLQRAAKADNTHPRGTIYYLVNGDVRAKTRRWAFASAADQLKKLGVNAEVIEGILPKEKPDVMGAMIGIADFDWKASGSTVLSGAICEHMTSTGGELAQYRGQTPCSQFLRFGAAGTSGAVQEPYALQDKFPTPFIHVYYARGCSLAESFFQSLAGPYQLIIVGDPLCAPWLHAPAVKLEGIQPNDIVKGAIVLNPVAAGPETAADFELYLDGARFASAKPGEAFKLHTEQFADGYHELTLVGIAADPIAGQSRAVVPMTIDNNGVSVSLAVKEQASIIWDSAVHVSASVKGAPIIEIRANGRQVGQIKGEQGSIEIPARELGLGQITIQAFAQMTDGKTVAAGKPAVLKVEPAYIPASPQKDPAAKKNGVLVIFDNGKSKMALPARENSWLKTLGFSKSHACTLEFWFDAPSDDLYQFQIQTPMTVSVEADGGVQYAGDTAKSAWQFVPLALMKGPHLFRVKLDAKSAEPLLDIRFGASGTHSLEANQFWCAEHRK